MAKVIGIKPLEDSLFVSFYQGIQAKVEIYIESLKMEGDLWH